ncbi:MAG: hypothetical protein M3R61_00235 [Chloroflexota bacterium]|nr:hypothetical protein [Chloroflexota bacterium]
MGKATDDPIGRAIQAILGARPTAAQRRQLAEQLRQFADEQAALADADTRVGHVVRRSLLERAPRSAKGGRPRGTGARFIRIEPRERGHGAYVYIGRALWQEIGEPVRFDLQRIGGALTLRPARGDDGYAFTRPPNGMPKATVGQDTVEALHLDEGRYPAEIRAGAIVVS